jgi:AbrB family looped-hinge helix DNA binding protein
MPRATITSKGQITLPKAIRERLGLSTGDQVDFQIEDDGSITVVSVKRSALRLHGVVGIGDAEPLSIEKMDQAIADRAASEDERIRKDRL